MGGLEDKVEGIFQELGQKEKDEREKRKERN